MYLHYTECPLDGWVPYRYDFGCSRFDQVPRILNSLYVCLPSDIHVCK